MRHKSGRHAAKFGLAVAAAGRRRIEKGRRWAPSKRRHSLAGTSLNRGAVETDEI
jgi:hypothetical protein